MSLATLKTKVQALIDELKIHKSCISQLSSFEFKAYLSYYTVPKDITNWDNLFKDLSHSTITVESNADISSMNSTFYDITNKNCVLTLNINTRNVSSFNNCFSGGTRRGGAKEILGTPLDFSNAEELNAFTHCTNLTELRVKENTIPYSVWDLTFEDSNNLSEETLLSIAKGIIRAPDSVPDEECAFISFSATVLNNMPEYIKQIFKEKRCELG